MSLGSRYLIHHYKPPKNVVAKNQHDNFLVYKSTVWAGLGGEAHLCFMCCQLGWIDYSLRIQLKVDDKLMLAVNWEPQVLSIWTCSLTAWAFSKSRYSKRHKGDDSL